MNIQGYFQDAKINKTNMRKTEFKIGDLVKFSLGIIGKITKQREDGCFYVQSSGCANWYGEDSITKLTPEELSKERKTGWYKVRYKNDNEWRIAYYYEIFSYWRIVASESPCKDTFFEEINETPIEI